MKNIDTNEEQTIDMIIDGLGVFELRGVARQLGVSSPTTKKRDELIELIKQAIENGATTKDGLQKRGRPFKRLNVLDSITDKINNKVVKMDFSNTKKVVRFSQDYVVPLDLQNFEGIVLKYSFNIEMRDILTGTLVKFDKTEELDELLQTGDKVKAVVEKVENNFFVKEILAINDVDFKDYRSKFITKGCPILVNDEIPFAGTKAVVGRRNLYKLDSELFECDYIENLISYCKKEDYSLIVLAINTSFENEIMFNTLSLKERFVTTYGIDNKISYHKILDAVNYAENLMDRGKKVVIFIADIIEVVRILEKHFTSKEEDEVDNESLDDATILITQKLIKFARAYKSGCNGTLIMCYNEVDKNDKFLTNELFKISKRLN